MTTLTRGSAASPADPQPLIVEGFHGPGGWAEGRRLLGLRTRAVGMEWDAAATKTATAAGHKVIRTDVAAYPTAPFKGRIVGKVDSPPCFPAGTPVLTERGVLPIEEVREGDYVLTHRLRWRRVVAAGSKSANTVILRGQGTAGLEATPNHRIWTRTYRSWRSGSDRSLREEWSAPDWAAAEDCTGLRWAVPASIPEGDARDLPITPWLLGRWVADGWANADRGEVCWGIGASKIDEFSARCDLDVNLYRQEGSVRVTACSKRELAEWLTANFGRGAAGKTIPGWLLCQPESVRSEFLAGYLAGDGCRVDANALKCVTVSRSLACGLRLLAAGLGYAVSEYLNNPEPTKIMHDGRKVQQRPWYAITIRRQKTRQFMRQQDGLWWGTVRRVEQGRAAVTVYDLEVEEDHSYLADGIVVHNCQAWSQGGHLLGLVDQPLVHQAVDDLSNGRDTRAHLLTACADKRSLLAAEPMRWFYDLRPEWVALEEVPAVLPLWKQYARILRGWGYSVWAGILHAADYGLGQARRRAVLIASRVRHVTAPVPTHAEHPFDDLFGGRLLKWRTMADTLDWGYTRRPAPTVTGGGTETGGAEPFSSTSRAAMRAAMENPGHWAWRKPAPTVTGTVGHVGGKQAGGHLNLTVEEAAKLQSFPDGYPFQGNKGQKSLQVGNAMPPLLAAHVLSVATGVPFVSAAVREVA